LQLSEESDRFACYQNRYLRYQNRFDKPHHSSGATQAAPLGEEQHLLMESHHDDDETKGSVYLFVQDYIEAREASGSVSTAGPKDLTVTNVWYVQNTQLH
jgi:hypothetical protein